MHSVWQFIIDHQAILGWLGGGIATVGSAGWAVYIHFFPTKERKAKAEALPSVMVTQSGQGIAFGNNGVFSGTANFGLDEKKTGEQIAAANKPLDDKLERILTEISRNKGVPIAPLRAILLKLGEAGVSEETIPQRLDAKADELLKLRDEVAQIRQGPPELASFAQRAQALIDHGDLDRARAALAEGRAKAHELRERYSRYEADFLAREAEIDHLQLAYRSAATKYLEAAAIVAPLDEEKQWEFMIRRNNELISQGNEFGDNDAFLEAIASYRAALNEHTRERMPLRWTKAQLNLGVALLGLGERKTDTTQVEQAVTAFRAALDVYTRDRHPLDWALAQNNLGVALVELGARDSGNERLTEAVGAFRAALEERTRERVPLDWAATQNNLGDTLVTLGKRKTGTTDFKDAVTAFRAALSEYTRERAPFHWAITQNNLGTALLRLGERKSGTVRLEQAVDAFRAALEEFTRERAPLHWAMAQNNLGTALRQLGERESGTSYLEAAVVAFRAALEERTPERTPLHWAMTNHNLGNALTKLSERDSGTAHLKLAVNAYKAALSLEPYFSEQTRAALVQVEMLLASRQAASLQVLIQGDRT